MKEYDERKMNRQNLLEINVFQHATSASQIPTHLLVTEVALHKPDSFDTNGCIHNKETDTKSLEGRLYAVERCQLHCLSSVLHLPGEKVRGPDAAPSLSKFKCCTCHAKAASGAPSAAPATDDLCEMNCVK